MTPLSLVAAAPVLVLADAQNATQIEVALIGAIALIVGGGLQQLLSRKDKEPIAWKEAREAQHAIVVDLRHQLTEEKSEHAVTQQNFDNSMTGIQLRDQEITRLRDLLWANKINPNPAVSSNPAPPPPTVTTELDEGTMPA